MTTYTKETALYDTGAIAGDIQEAGAQVSKYITAIGDEGIKVHPYDATQGQADTDNYAKIDSDGMEIWQKPTGASASVKVAEFGAGGSTIYDENGEQSAQFGAMTIIGNNDSSKVVFEKQRFSMSSDTGLEYFVSEFDGSSIETKEITKTISYIISTSDVSFSHLPLRYSDENISNEIGDLTDGTAFTINGSCNFIRTNYGDSPWAWTNFSFGFVKGTDETKTFTWSRTSGSNTVSCSFSLRYYDLNGDSYFALTITSYQKNHSTKYTVRINLRNIKYDTRTPIPTVSIMGATTFTRTLNCDSNIEAAGGVIINKTDTAQKDLTYVNEYVRLSANQTASESAGQLTLSTSNKNCLVANKYDEVWSDYMNECVSVKNGVVTILKSGRYRFDYQVYFYNGFTANDIPICGIGLNGLNGALLRASRFKATVTNPFTTLSGSYTGWGEKGNTFYLIAQNSTAARGVVGLNQYTRLVVTCLMTY